MSDLPYPRAGRARQYVSVYYHMKNSRHPKKSKWESVSLERETFDAADYGSLTRELGKNSWLDLQGNLWGFTEGYKIIGTEKEQFGFFPATQNTVDPWHGYPIFPIKDKDYNFPKPLLDIWIEEGLIDEDDLEDIKNGRRL